MDLGVEEESLFEVVGRCLGMRRPCWCYQERQGSGGWVPGEREV